MNDPKKIHVLGEMINRRYKSSPKAILANFNAYTNRIDITLETGVDISIPIRLIFGIQNYSYEVLTDFSLMLEGSQIHWHTLDQQFSIKSLLEGAFVNQ